MKVNIYFDGFNFYYGAVRSTPFKWMDLRKLCEHLLPGDEINRIRYFTSRVDGTRDPGQPHRQNVYLRALDTVEGLSIHEGNFRRRRKRGDLVEWRDSSGRRIDHTSIPELSSPGDVTISAMEEKGSDVNLAAYLIRDAAKNDFEAAFIVSDDSDLVEAIRVARQDFGVRVGIINPYPRRDPRTGRRRDRTELRVVCTSGMYRHVDRSVFGKSLFPDPVELPDGTLLRKPRTW